MTESGFQSHDGRTGRQYSACTHLRPAADLPVRTLLVAAVATLYRRLVSLPQAVLVVDDQVVVGQHQLASDVSVLDAGAATRARAGRPLARVERERDLVERELRENVREREDAARLDVEPCAADAHRLDERLVLEHAADTLTELFARRVGVRVQLEPHLGRRVARHARVYAGVGGAHASHAQHALARLDAAARRQRRRAARRVPPPPDDPCAGEPPRGTAERDVRPGEHHRAAAHRQLRGADVTRLDVRRPVDLDAVTRARGARRLRGAGHGGRAGPLSGRPAGRHRPTGGRTPAHRRLALRLTLLTRQGALLYAHSARHRTLQSHEPHVTHLHAAYNDKFFYN